MKHSRMPNILLIVMDAVRADHMSCYGYQLNNTQYISKSASEGVLYEQAISSAGWTSPSHASMFTGTYPSKHGACNENHYLSNRFPTMAEVLAENGYSTIGISLADWISNATGLT